MPLLSMKLSVEIDNQKCKKLIAELSQIVADDLNKPVKYVMAGVEYANMALGRDASPCAFGELRSIGGLNRDVNAKISEHVCELLGHELGILPERVYMNFIDIPASNWGMDGGVFEK